MATEEEKKLNTKFTHYMIKLHINFMRHKFFTSQSTRALFYDGPEVTPFIHTLICESTVISTSVYTAYRKNAPPPGFTSGPSYYSMGTSAETRVSTCMHHFSESYHV